MSIVFIVPHPSVHRMAVIDRWVEWGQSKSEYSEYVDENVLSTIGAMMAMARSGKTNMTIETIIVARKYLRVFSTEA